MNVLIIEGIVKGYDECPVTVKTGESFSLEKKIGDRGEAFRVVNSRGQLGHIQKELVAILWPLESTIEW